MHPSIVLIVLFLELVSPNMKRNGDRRVITLPSVVQAKLTAEDYNLNAKEGEHWEQRIYFVDLTERSIEELR